MKADADRRKRGEEIAEAKARARQRRRKGKSGGEVRNSPNAPKVITSFLFLRRKRTSTVTTGGKKRRIKAKGRSMMWRTRKRATWRREAPAEKFCFIPWVDTLEKTLTYTHF